MHQFLSQYIGAWEHQRLQLAAKRALLPPWGLPGKDGYRRNHSSSQQIWGLMSKLQPKRWDCACGYTDLRHLSLQQGEELSQQWARSGGTEKALSKCTLEARAVLSTKRHRVIFVRLCKRVWGFFFVYTEKFVPSLKERPSKMMQN